MGKTHNFLRFIGKILDVMSDYGKIKQDPALRPKSKMFGVRSIILSCIGMFLISIFGNLTIRAITGLGSSSLGFFILIFFVIILVVIDFYLLGYFLIYPMICWILQLRLNKKAVGWIALALWIVLLFISVGSFFMVQSLL